MSTFDKKGKKKEDGELSNDEDEQTSKKAVKINRKGLDEDR